VAILGLVAILCLGCGDQPSAPTTGSIRLSVSNIGDPLDLDADGFTYSIDDGPSKPLGPYRQLTIGDVGVGTHLVTLGDVAANCSVVGTNSRSVEVPPARDAGMGVPVAFVVACAPKTGTIQVTTTTVGDDQDADGYTVEIGGQGKARVQSSGTVTIAGVREGGWVVSLGDVASNCTVDLASHGISVNVAFGQTAQVALTVRCVPAGSLVVTTVVSGDDYFLYGYALRVLRADGSIVTDARVPTNGTVTIPGLLPGQYRLLLLSVFPNCVLVPANPIAAVVLVGTATPITFGVVCEGPRRIAFVGGSGKDADIFVIYSNGTGSTRITTATGADLDPAWSPDGSKIAFASERDGNFEIYSMSSSGENPVRLTQNPASDSRPAWSPDGSRIAFVSNRDGNSEIYVMNADGTNQLRLTSNLAVDSDPDWSPDGTRIAFSSEREIGGIWIMSADGSDASRITSNVRGDYQPAWSPDGSRIAFSRGLSATSRDIYFVSSDGSSIVPFVTDRENASDPSWSPDGRNLTFATLQCVMSWYYDDYCAYGLEIKSADGTRYLSIGHSNESNPAYQQ
jgi:Tol biopolymer transport system component